MSDRQPTLGSSNNNDGLTFIDYIPSQPLNNITPPNRQRPKQQSSSMPPTHLDARFRTSNAPLNCAVASSTATWTDTQDLIVISSDEEDERESKAHPGYSIDDPISLDDEEDMQAARPPQPPPDIAPAPARNEVVSEQLPENSKPELDLKQLFKESGLQRLRSPSPMEVVPISGEHSELADEDSVKEDEREQTDDDDDDFSVSSSELVFAAKPLTMETDIALLHAMNAPDDEYDMPDWNQLTSLGISKEDEKMRVVEKEPELEEPSLKTRITKNTSLHELLSMVDAYDVSVRGPLEAARLNDVDSSDGTGSPSPTKAKRVSMRKGQKKRPNNALQKEELRKPYVPCSVWDHVTWEDWAQLEVGDWLHWPFEEWETAIIKEAVEKHNGKSRKRKADGIGADDTSMWESIALKLPGRRAQDCSRYWNDHTQNLPQIYKDPVIISHQPWHSKRVSVHGLIRDSRYSGRSRTALSKTAIWPALKHEHAFGDGSADTLAVQILNKRGKSNKIKVIAASACNDQPEYNMPGNLRIWSANTKKIAQLRGHKTTAELADGTEQHVWHTITDVRVSHDQKLIYTSSHDKTSKVWCGRTGKMLSTLCFHEKKVHQLAVCPDTREYILASGSGDGTAVIWSLNGSGNVGAGLVCTVDKKLTRNPSVDTLVFGRGPSKGILYTGITSGLQSPLGFIQGFDVETGEHRCFYKSMNGAVCDIDVSESGQYIISGNHSPFDEFNGDGFVHLNDTRTTTSVIKARTGHTDVNLVRMSPCERFVASGNPNNETAVIDIRRPDKVLFRLCHKQTLADHLIPINSDMGISGMHWMSDSRILVTGGGDCSVKLWDIFGNGEVIKSYQTPSNISSLAVDENAMMICAGVAGAQGYVHVWTAAPL
ncbi:WD40-repeat-containing domain protein [Fennellomyces sp. T-0311]|nr:WD40-repeat-containing domain protein [Fennellomyces sp. T-0311]